MKRNVVSPSTTLDIEKRLLASNNLGNKAKKKHHSLEANTNHTTLPATDLDSSVLILQNDVDAATKSGAILHSKNLFIYKFFH